MDPFPIIFFCVSCTLLFQKTFRFHLLYISLALFHRIGIHTHFIIKRKKRYFFSTNLDIILVIDFSNQNISFLFLKINEWKCIISIIFLIANVSFTFLKIYDDSLDFNSSCLTFMHDFFFVFANFSFFFLLMSNRK
jgi:hypothetical protein